VHDAVLLEVPYRNVSKVMNEVLPYCMCDMVPVMPRRLDGSAIPGLTKPYHFDIDKEVMVHWGVPLKGGELRELGLAV